MSIERLEQKLDSFDSAERKQALVGLYEQVKSGRVTLPKAGTDVNLHCHTFFSYNCYGYSPSKFAWLSRKAGLAVVGVVDFDVLDGLEEFLESARLLNLKASVGLETRVFVPEFADKVINSPDEPGIAYHIGAGFPTAHMTGWLKDFLDNLKKTAQKRNLGLMQRVNKYLSPVELDYEQDVLPLTPAGNPTERHICLGFARKAARVFANNEQLAKFWSDKLSVDAESLDLPEGRELLDIIRARTMKRGGVGYVQPDAGAFLKMAEMNRFVLAAGGIPVLAWLDGTSDAESRIKRLLEVAMESGAAAVNIIPDRNYTPGVKDKKLENLYQVVELAEKLHLPVIVGTEMNSPGQKFVDSFDSQELSPLVPIFLKGAHIFYAHSVLQRKCGLGYCSEWANKNFKNTAEKNEFFQDLGSLLEPAEDDELDGLTEDVTALQISDRMK